MSSKIENIIHDDFKNNNEYKVNNFNSLRKANIKFETDNIKRFSNDRNLSDRNLILLEKNDGVHDYSQFYTSGDGTRYKTTNKHSLVETTIDLPKNALHVPGKYHELYRHSVTFEEIPQNLKHKFGTNDTNDLLKDQVKVHDGLSSIQNKGIIKKNDKTKIIQFDNNEVSLEKYETGKSNEDYLDLGNHLRHTVSHGYPMVNCKSTTYYDFNSDISKKFLTDKNNYTSSNRRTKDWLSTWTELSIVDTRQNNELKDMLKSQSKSNI